MNTPLHDLHIHTNLSLCSSDPEQTVENIAAWAAAHGVGTIGISNHVWIASGAGFLVTRLRIASTSEGPNR